MKTNTKIIIFTGMFFLVIFLIVYNQAQSSESQKQEYYKNLTILCHTPYEINISGLQEEEIKPLKLAYLLRNKSEGLELTTYQISDLYVRCCDTMNLSCDVINMITDSEYQKIYSALVNFKENDSRLISFSSTEKRMRKTFTQYSYNKNNNYSRERIKSKSIP
ncbi:MAG TPA: hypothetical protein ENI61_06225 [Ignavibacteria bacterium]|nr:hypothetical protein [Ignavibacteria bacterium]